MAIETGQSTAGGRLVIAASVAAVALLGLSHALSAFPPPVLDDPHITFRYAENIAAGRGFVFNEGEHVLGTSTPLYALLLAIPAALGVPAPWAGSVVEVLATLLIGTLIVLLFAQSGRPLIGALTVLLLATAGRYLYFEGAGMEMPLHLASIMLVFALMSWRRYGIACAIAWIPTLLRPEGFLIAAPILWGLWRDRTLWRARPHTVLVGIGVSAALVGAWAIFAWLYFGSILPHSVVAKRALYSEWEWVTFGEAMARKYLYPADGRYALCVFIWLGLVFAVVRNRASRLLWMWLALCIAFFTLSGAPLFSWYTFPVHVLAFVAIGHAVWAGAALLERKTPSPVVMGAASLLAVSLLALDFRISWTQAQFSLSSMKRYEVIGEWLREHAPEGMTVAAMEIGVLGYHSDMRVLDLAGLVSPEVVPLLTEVDGFGIVQHFRPELFVHTVTDPDIARSEGLGVPPELLAEYVEVHRETYDAFGREGLVTAVFMRADLAEEYPDIAD